MNPITAGMLTIPEVMAMAATPPMRARGRLIMIMPDRERLLNSWKSNRNIISKAMADVNDKVRAADC